jgi:hypothetical protein
MASGFFRDSDYFTGPSLTHDMVVAAEAVVGRKLPASYVDLLAERNGGSPVRRCFPTAFPTSWASDHFEVSAIVGVGGMWGIDADLLGSVSLVAEWGYPDIGVVIAHTPSGGHDTVMLDYTDEEAGEPRVVYVDEDRVPKVVAGSFADFIDRLLPCDGFGAE